MTALIIPILLTIIGVVGVIYTYSSIRRGGARVYSLEREIILRRATTALFFSTLAFLGAVGILVFQLQSVDTTAVVVEQPPPAVEEGETEPDLLEVTPELLPTDSGAGDNIPALVTQIPTPTIDPNIPTATPTPIIIRAFIVGTSGNGLSMRDNPGGELLIVLPEDTLVTVVTEEPTVEQGGFTWIKIRTFTGEEGWVARQFLEIEGDS